MNPSSLQSEQLSERIGASHRQRGRTLLLQGKLVPIDRRLAPIRSLSGIRFIPLGLLLLFSPTAFGEMVWTYDRDNDLRTIQLTVTPADEPRPALRHRLTLRPQDLRPGNSVAHYMRAYPGSGSVSFDRYFHKEYGEEFGDWYNPEFPLSNFPPKKVKEATETISTFIRNFFDPASRCRDCDWGYKATDLQGGEVISFRLPEIQGMREVSRLLSLHARVAIADGRYDEAINSLRISYRLGQDLGQQKILVSGLVGIAITGYANRGTTELIAAPDSPNLYWALSELPNPPISIREALRLDLAMAPRMHLVLDNPDEEHTPEEWNAIWQKQWMAFFNIEGGWKPVRVFVPLLSGLNGYAHAKQRLMDWGHAPEEVERMAVGQVLAIYSARVYQIAADEEEKAYYVPFSQRLVSDHIGLILGIFSDHPDRELIPVAQIYLPASQACMSAEARVAREIAALRVIEALRMHAAQNEGRLPRSLDTVTCVPVPLNPATDKPFRYHLEHKTAVLELPDWEGFPGRSVRYEITIAEAE